jgi:glycosyltransferase involved in cell wall biosynthesis
MSESDMVIPKNPSVLTRMSPALSVPKLRFTYSPGYYKFLLNLIQDNHSSIIHSHSLWMPSNFAVAKVARKNNLLHVVSPRGTLSPWAFNYRAWKKKPIWMLWQKKALSQAAGFCATSNIEAEHIRMLGFEQPIAVIPNGVEMSPYNTKLPDPQGGLKTALFLSRIHPVKGVCELINAWAKVRPLGWKVILAGPNEEDHLSKVKKEINKFGLEGQFEIVGEVHGAEKSRLFNEANLFILPSFTENFGVVIAEALAAATPVITTKGSPWEALETHQCGWWVDVGVDPLAKAIKIATDQSGATLAEMGLRGQSFVDKEFRWSTIAHKTACFYDYILGKADKPDFVI